MTAFQMQIKYRLDSQSLLFFYIICVFVEFAKRPFSQFCSKVEIFSE